MLSIFKISISNLRKKKTQNILIGIILMVSSILLATSLNMMRSNKDAFKKIHKNLNAGHTLIQLDNLDYDINTLEKWWKNEKNIDIIQTYPYKKVDMVHNGVKINSPILLMERILNPNIDNLKVIEGENKREPGIGEVWVPSGYAYNNNIKINDDIYVSGDNGNIKLKVSAIIVDIHFSSGLINPCGFWIRKGSLTSLGAFSRLNSSMLSIKYHNFSEEESKSLISNFKKEFKSLNTLVMNYDSIEGSYLFLLDIMGLISAIISVILIIIALYIIYSTISNSIISEYKNIGILKSLGFTSLNVISIYLIQYGIVSSIFILLGIGLSKFSLKFILGNVKGVCGIIEGNFLFSQMLLLFLTMIALIMLVVYITANKCRKISAVEAIVFGAPSKSFNKSSFIKISNLRRFSVSIILGIKNIFYNKKQSAFITITALVTSLVLTFSITVSSLFLNTDKIGSDIGFVQSDIVITRDNRRFGYSHEALLEKLKAEKNIDSILDTYFLNSFFVYNEDKAEYKDIHGYIYGNSIEDFNFKYLNGRNPKNKNEIAIAVNTSKELKKNVGDIINFNIEGVDRRFIVSGIFQTHSNFGSGFRMLYETYKEINPVNMPTEYNLKIKKDVNKKAYIEDLKLKLGSSVTVMDNKEKVAKSVGMISISIIGLLTAVSLIFLAVTSIAVINSTFISINMNKKIYGIYKSLGMTSKDIRLSVIYTIGFCTLIGSLCGIFMSTLLSGKVLNLLLSKIGTKLTVTHSFIHVTIVLLSCLCINSLSTFIASKKIKTINPKNLIVE